MADLAQEGCPFRGQVELDESYFGPTRTHGHRGRGNPRKTPVFGILERGGRVHCQIVKNCLTTTLMATVKGEVELSAEIVTDDFRSYINRYWQRDRPVYVEDCGHINGIESFWSYAKRRHQKFSGLRRASFPSFLKETEFRFNNREQDLYKLLLTSCRMEPLIR